MAGAPFTIRQQIRRPGGWIVAILVAAVLFVALNAALRPVGGIRLDLTEERLFTLSDGTREMLADLETPVELTLYLSPDLPQEAPAYGPFAQRVRDLLAELSEEAGGTVTLERVEVTPFSPQEDAAVEAGLRGLRLSADGDKYYFGLLARTAPADPEAETFRVALPLFQPERARFLEYDVAKMIHRLQNPEKPVVGVVSGTEVFGNFQQRLQGGNPEPWAIIPHMQDFFQVERLWQRKDFRRVEPDVLAIIHPSGLNERMLYEIDQYLMEGGKALLFLDPWHETAIQGSRMGGLLAVDTESDFEPFLSHWGLEIPKGHVVGDRTMGRRVNVGTDEDPTVAPYVGWLEPKPMHLNPTHPLTQDVNAMLIPTPGEIRLSEDSPLTMEPLIRTSPEAMRIDTDKLAPPDALTLLDEYEPLGEPLVIGARLTGRTRSAFPEGNPDPDHERPAHLAESGEPLDLILIADSDMLVDRYWVREQPTQDGGSTFVPVTDNGAFLVNALDYLSGSDALISLRSRGTGKRPFDVIHDIRREAEQEFRTRERRLREEMAALEEKLGQVRDGAAGPEILEGRSPAAAVDAFTAELVETRKALRAVTFKLRERVERLEARIEFLNIAAIPLALTAFALVLGLVRLRLRRRT